MDRGQLVQDRYEVEGYRASNSTIELYDAIDRQLDRPVTLQIVHEALAHDAQLAGAFEAHQKIGLSLYNCSVLAIYDVGVHDGRVFSVMERFRPLVPGDYLLKDDAPNVPVALKLTRQVAEGLACCREAGLRDWPFSTESVGLDSESNVRLAILEQPPSTNPLGDVAAVGEFLRSLLSEGTSSAGESALPVAVVGLLERLEGRAVPVFASLSELAAGIAETERASSEPTQAYVLEAPDLRMQHSPEAPTLVAPVVMPEPAVEPEHMATQQLTIMPELVPAESGASMNQVASGDEARAGRFPIMIGLLGLIAAMAVLFVLLPRLVDSRADLAAVNLAGPTATSTVPVAQDVSLPDLKGLTIDEATAKTSALKLSLVTGASGSDGAQPPDTVLSQIPAAGTVVQSGSVITVSLNVIVASQPTAVATAVPEQESQPVLQAPPPPQSEGNKKKDNNKDKGKAKDKDK